MVLKKQGIILIVGVFALAVLIGVIAFSDSQGTPVRRLVMFFALYGYFSLSLATITTPFLREITQVFGKPFIEIHHSLAVFGIGFITLHPVFNAIETLSLAVFVPIFSSWINFWIYAGRLAFIIVYIAVFAALLRRHVIKYWRFFHMLMYVVLLFGIVHANLIGQDFQNPAIAAIFDALFIAAIASFVLKRYRNYQLKQRLLKAKMKKA